MTTRDRVLEFLELNKGENISGERLAEALNISRNAIWKAVNSLRSEGFMLDASPKRGYCLLIENDKLSEQSIRKYFKKPNSFRFSVYDSLPSTNTQAKQAADSGEEEGLIVITNEQTSGKGRLGRSFYSPPGSGIYMSLILRPKIPVTEALLITTAAAVAVAQAIEDITGKCSEIKWVNDIFCSGKKVCGILTEASLDFESGGISYAVLGIGINLTDPNYGFPDEISSIVGSVYGINTYPPETKPRLIASVVERFSEYYYALADKKFMDEYRRRSSVIGKNIYVISPNSREEATALEIDDDASLIVRMNNGDIRHLNSGEISVRVKTHE